jgi:hypothetical protein
MGHHRIGWRANPGAPGLWVANPDEQDVIVLMRELYDESGSYRAEARALDARGIKRRRGRAGFDSKTVKAILVREGAKT